MYVKYLEPRSDTPGDVRIAVATADRIVLSQTGNVIAVHRHDIDQLIDILQQIGRAADWEAEYASDDSVA